MPCRHAEPLVHMKLDIGIFDTKSGDLEVLLALHEVEKFGY